MNICVTELARAAVLLSLLLAATAPVAADELELRGEATLGARLYDLDSPYDGNDLSSFFDQYRHIQTKSGSPPSFVDLTHLDAGLVRPDETHLLRLERWSEGWWNDRALLNLDWRGLEFDADYQRYRSDELRVFPMGTRETAPPGFTIAPTFGSSFNPDAGPGNPLGLDRPLFTRRTRVGGELRLRPDGFAASLPGFDELQLSARHERRKGERQDRFLLDFFGTEPALPQAQWRGVRRERDQEVTTLGGGLVLSPGDLFTADIDVSYERFREDAPVIDLASLAASDPRIMPFSSAQEVRAFNFVPDTDRLSGSIRLSRRIGGATFHAGAFLSELEQKKRDAPLQVERDDLEVTVYSLNGAFDLPLGEYLGLNGFVKYVHRRNDLRGEDFDLLGAFANVQVDEYIKKRRELRGGLELSATPVAGTRLAAGYRLKRVDRDLRCGPDSRSCERATTADPAGVLYPEFQLIREESTVHTGYLSARTRLLRSLQLSGEVGYESVPDVALPRELEHVFYAKGRGSYALRRLPVSFSFSGGVRDGSNDEIRLESLTPGRSKDKEFERTEWHYSATVTALPTDSLVLFASFAQHRDEQEFSYLRSNNPRNFFDPNVPSSLQFFLDSELGYETDVRTLIFGATSPLGKALDLSLSSQFTWARARLPSGGASADVLELAAGLKSRILSLEGRLGYRARPWLRLELGYRFDDFRDEQGGLPLTLDTDVHTYLLGATLDFGRLLAH